MLRSAAEYKKEYLSSLTKSNNGIKREKRDSVLRKTSNEYPRGLCGGKMVVMMVHSMFVVLDCSCGGKGDQKMRRT